MRFGKRSAALLAALGLFCCGQIRAFTVGTDVDRDSLDPVLELRQEIRFPLRGAMPIPADEGMGYDTTVNSTRLWIVGAGLTAGNAAIMAYYFTTFYSPRESERSAWHTFNDWYNSDLNVDKLGHVWGSQAYANTLYHVFRWTGTGETASSIWSTGVAWIFQMEMEMTDAFYRKWGFSWWDVGANTLGAVLPAIQRAVPGLDAVTLKMSYHPSALIRNHWVDYVLKDYDGFTYWLGLSVEDLLPRTWKPYWPDWLGIAVGFGADRTVIARNSYNTDRYNRGLGDQEWYIALDYDLRKLPGDTPLLKFLKEEFNLLHLPSPAIRFSPSAIYYGIYF